MEAYLKLEAHIRAIESATDFTYKWCNNMGMEPDEAARFTLAVDELLTNMILFAYPESRGSEPRHIELWYKYSIPYLEIIIQESGEPFDPDRYRYSPKKALTEGNFEGAGLKLVRELTDHFLFLNRGKEGKEFRLAKQLPEPSLSKFQEDEDSKVNDELEEESSYEHAPVTKEDAEDIAKLIYRSYNYSYTKEDLYFPKQNELAIEHGKKFGTIIRTKSGRPVGYFTVIRIQDSLVGEVGEAVVSLSHRRKGLMTRMLNELIEMSKQRNLLGLYGLALTVHSISQKVNQVFGFYSTALLVAVTKGYKYKDSTEDHPQPATLVVDFLPLIEKWNPKVYLPARYRSMLLQLYQQFDIEPTVKNRSSNGRSSETDNQTDMHVEFTYRNRTATIVVDNLGNSFITSARSMMRSLDELNLTAIYIDIPLEEKSNDEAVEWLCKNGFIFSGLMPKIHHEKDYLRMQRIMVPINFELVNTYSETANRLKEFINHEYHELQEA